MDNRYNWTRLNNLQLGKYAEYYAKMEFTLHGFDVYTAEVDDKGIDFVIRFDTLYYDIQVKSSRDNNYIFFPKSKFTLRENLFATIVLFENMKEPTIYIIPSIEWKNLNKLLVSRDYIHKKSKPEWGLCFTHKNLELLQQYQFESMIKKILIKENGMNK